MRTREGGGALWGQEGQGGGGCWVVAGGKGGGGWGKEIVGVRSLFYNVTAWSSGGDYAEYLASLPPPRLDNIKAVCPRSDIVDVIVLTLRIPDNNNGNEDDNSGGGGGRKQQRTQNLNAYTVAGRTASRGTWDPQCRCASCTNCSCAVAMTTTTKQ